MKTTSLDLLEKSELPPTQSHAILKVMELEMASAHDALATKVDLLVLKTDLLAFKSEVEAEFVAVRAEMKAEFAAVRAEIRAAEIRQTRWMVGCMMGQTTFLAGLGYFALTHLVK